MNKTEKAKNRLWENFDKLSENVDKELAEEMKELEKIKYPPAEGGSTCSYMKALAKWQNAQARIAEIKELLQIEKPKNTKEMIDYLLTENRITIEQHGAIQLCLAGELIAARQSSKEDGEWISVKDRLPEKATFIVVCKHNGLVLGMYYNADKEFMYGEQNQTTQITHWQHLPKSAPQTYNN